MNSRLGACRHNVRRRGQQIACRSRWRCGRDLFVSPDSDPASLVCVPPAAGWRVSSIPLVSRPTPNWPCNICRIGVRRYGVGHAPAAGWSGDQRYEEQAPTRSHHARQPPRLAHDLLSAQADIVAGRPQARIHSLAPRHPPAAGWSPDQRYDDRLVRAPFHISFHAAHHRRPHFTQYLGEGGAFGRRAHRHTDTAVERGRAGHADENAAFGQPGQQRLRAGG